MPIVFIAVQCYQCSTMQVKQQKRSSNKWNCVVCGEKQSLRKVFARGFQAKDVRKFVQGFNMGRQIAADSGNVEDDDETLISTPEQQQQIVDVEDNHQPRRRDWTEYLDLGDEPEEESEEAGGDCEPVIVTELPKELFKKPKLTNYTTGTSKSEKKLYSPTFEKRKPSNKIKQINSQMKNYSGGSKNISQGKKLYSPTFAKRRKTDNTPNDLQEYKGVVKSLPTLGREPSKWSDYLAEDEDYMLFGTEDFSDAQGPWNPGRSETSFSSQRVEEEVHPDFH